MLYELEHFEVLLFVILNRLYAHTLLSRKLSRFSFLMYKLKYRYNEQIGTLKLTIKKLVMIADTKYLDTRKSNYWHSVKHII